jgi:cytochrome c oxidase subunit IV
LACFVGQIHSSNLFMLFNRIMLIYAILIHP